MSTAAWRSEAISRAAASPSKPGILMSRMASSGLCSRTRATASSPLPVSPTTSYPSSSRISLRSRRTMASSSAMTTRTTLSPAGSAIGFLAPRWATVLAFPAVSAGVRYEPLEQLVLGPLQLFYRGDDRSPAPCHGVGVTLGVVVVPPGEGRLRDEGADAGVFGHLGEGPQLLVDYIQLLPGAAQAAVDLDQSPLDEFPRHGRDSVRPATTVRARQSRGRPHQAW